MYKVIDPNKWNRKSTYEWFKTFSNPCYSFDVELDVTDIVNYSKETKTSFFINFLYILQISLNSVDELRLRIVNDEIRLYDVIDPTYTVLKDDLSFDNCGSKMFNDYKSFYNDAEFNINRIKSLKENTTGYNDDLNYSVYYHTCIPWLNYKSMTHPLPDNNPESSSVPRTCWGKYERRMDRYYMPFNLTVSHVLVDGYHMAKALNQLKDNCLNPLGFYK